MRPTILVLFLMFAGTSSFATAAGQDQNVQPVGHQATTPLKTDVGGIKGEEGNMIIVELAPGTVDARHFHPGVELVYVLEGAGLLEAVGKPPVALNVGNVAALHPKRIHALRNASQSQSLKVLVVLLPEKGQQRPMLENRGSTRHQVGGEPMSNGDLSQQKANEHNSKGTELVF